MLRRQLLGRGQCGSRQGARLQCTGGSALPHTGPHPALQLRRQQVSRHSAAAATGSDGDRGYSAEEAAAYEEILRQSKAAKQEALQELKRKRKFNPLHAKLKVSPADTPADKPAAAAAHDGAEPGAAADAAAAAAAAGMPSSSVASPRFAARPRAAPSTLQQQQQQGRAASRPVAPTAAQAAQQQAHQQATQPLQEAGGDDDGDVIEGPAGRYMADSELAAMLAELMAGNGEDVPEVQPLPAKAQRRKSPAQLKAAAIAKSVVTQQLWRKQQAALKAAAAAGEEEDEDKEEYEDGAEGDVDDLVRVQPQQLLQQQGAKGGGKQPAAVGKAAAGADKAAGGPAYEDDGGDDDLDWEALGQYEQLEKYLSQLQKENSGAALRRARLDPAATPKPPPAAAAPPSPPKPPAAAAAKPAAPQAAGSARQVGSLPAAASAGAGTGAAAGPKRARSSSSSKMDRDLDELEQLVAMLQAMESGSNSSSSNRQQLQRPTAPAQVGAAGGQAAAAVGGDSGEALLKALLGSDWEAELLDDLAAVIDEEDEQMQPQLNSWQQRQLSQLPRQAAAAGAAGLWEQGQEGQEQEEDQEPWADDVTALLLGLVSISHEKYLHSALPLPGGIEAVGEDERCGAFWGAPWALFVVDDGAQSCIEYVNEACAGLLGGGYLDLFGRATHELVAPSLTAQSDWAYAVHKVEESASFSVVLPQLELQDLAGRPVIARDVTMWRVDSLEDTPIGMAVLVQSWQRV